MKWRKKEGEEKNEGSLAFRILFIILLCLVFPLLTLTSLLYLGESRMKVDNNLFTLKVLMEQKQAVLGEIIDGSVELLKNLSFFLSKMDPSDITKALQELAKRSDLLAFLHVQKEKEGELSVDQASDQTFLAKDLSPLIASAKKDALLVVDPDLQIFYLTWLAEKQEEGWIMVFSLTHLLRNFPVDTRVIHPVSISIVSEEGNVLFSTNPTFKECLADFPKEGNYVYQGKEYIGLSQPIPKTNFSFVIATPEAVHFVDFPKLVFKILWILTGMVILGGGVTLLLIKKLSKPLKELTATMKEIERGNLSHRFHKQKMGFEINAIGRIFNETVDSLEVHMEAVQKERIDKETYEKELKIGQEVQRSILPKNVPDYPGIQMAARFLSAKEVGGDFYDFLVKDRLMISIADTAGKGISACLYSLSVRSLLKGYGQVYPHLDRIIQETNALFCQDTGETGVFVTAFVAFFDPTTRIFEYTNCGHLPALCFKKNGRVKTLTTKGMALGVAPFDHVEVRRMQLESEDLLVLFTDGIIEAHNKDFSQFHQKRLIRSIRKIRGKNPEQIVQAVIEEVMAFAGGTPQFDDLSLVAIKVI